ncbi:hypothetical protein FB384_005243 [Prauserella sediminis]|uniref:ArsR family transcriptional regulator n=1 Tax=Prauserella sediminis TaxID=577680 RepID=A0A839XR49_9PSEU|nr:hypothetical protein [Prauserella sediminis]MBB3666282.1 hypothetical protein [Prauserella sediminis]
MSDQQIEISHRTRAILRAISQGRVQVTLSCEPDVFIDGLAFSDQAAARALVHAGLLRASRPGRIGERGPATLTDAGLRVLDPAERREPQDSIA